MDFMYVITVTLVSGTESGNFSFDLFADPEDMTAIVRTIFNESGKPRYRVGSVYIQKINKIVGE